MCQLEWVRLNTILAASSIPSAVATFSISISMHLNSIILGLGLHISILLNTPWYYHIQYISIHLNIIILCSYNTSQYFATPLNSTILQTHFNTSFNITYIYHDLSQHFVKYSLIHQYISILSVLIHSECSYNILNQHLNNTLPAQSLDGDCSRKKSENVSF